MPKVSGLAAKEVWTIDISDTSKIPARYLITEAGPLVVSGDKAVVLVQLDGKVLSVDAKAGRLDKADWCKATKGTSTSAR
jgi:hypothetical protein